MEATRIKLGLSEEDAQQIFTRIAREELHKTGVCPHCHKRLYKRHRDDEDT